jgi:hypothetical protein
MNMKSFLFFLHVSLIAFVRGQGQPVAVKDFKDQHVIYLDLGFSPAPFSISYPFTNEVGKLKYKNNFKPILGLAYAYKWFSMRVSFPVLPGVRSIEKYGKSKQFGIGFDYNFKRLYTDIDFRIVQGYAIKNALAFDTSLSANEPNRIYPQLSTRNLSFNLWYFNTDDFKMTALQGKRAHFEKQVHTWYVKGTLNYFRVTHGSQDIIPSLLQDPQQSKTSAQSYSALDFGVIPGYAYANRINNWQFSGWAGIGPVIQSKFYTIDPGAQGFLGIAPRYDIKFVTGYSTPERFILLAGNFDNKSAAFTNLTYRQFFYTIRLVVGLRIPPKT